MYAEQTFVLMIPFDSSCTGQLYHSDKDINSFDKELDYLCLLWCTVLKDKSSFIRNSVGSPDSCFTLRNRGSFGDEQLSDLGKSVLSIEFVSSSCSDSEKDMVRSESLDPLLNLTTTTSFFLRWLLMWRYQNFFYYVAKSYYNLLEWHFNTFFLTTFDTFLKCA
jgi:hypothetical protein